jgi:hypothetical protein
MCICMYVFWVVSQVDEVEISVLHACVCIHVCMYVFDVMSQGDEMEGSHRSHGRRHTRTAAPTPLQESPNCDTNSAPFRAILARVPRDADKRHGSPTSAQGLRKLQIVVVVKAVIVRVSWSVLVSKSGSGFVVVEIKLA